MLYVRTEAGMELGCNDDSDCEARIDGRSKCSVPSGECVDCLVETDCASDEQCVDNDCRPQTSCTTSSDCPPSLVCDPSYRICVECVSSSDCAASETCLNDSNTCVERCSVDSHCAPSGQRCNGSYCVNCLSDSDCDGSRHCDDATSTCVRDVCVEGESNCENNSVVGCNDNGSMPLVPEPCLSNESCVEGASGATCEVRICTPSMATCSTTDETVLRCSEDGLTQEVEEDCADTMQLCYGGVCIDAVCTPNTAFCAGTEVRVCDSTGTMSSLQTTCQGTQRCNPAC